MNLIADWIEQKIQEAIAKGEFENLPGAGKPLDLDEDLSIPQEMRMAFRVLKNSGFLPPEILAHQEIQELKKKISENKDLSYDEYQKIKLQLVQKETAFNIAVERMAKLK
ncbi:hypothetical protein D3C72_1200630 [compost metagenome]